MPTRFDLIVNEFSAAWSAGQRPDIGAVLRQIGDGHRDDVVIRLLSIDIAQRIESGDQVSAGDYASLGPVVSEHARRILDRNATPSVDAVALTVASSGHRAKRRTTQAANESPAPRQIGPYKLRQQIGEGGMGTVWMAEQEKPVRRTVALKLIKSGMDSKQVVARFEAERQALAMMDHPNIAKVLDAGLTNDGTPYFAMELVEGMPITKYCDLNELSIENRLDLFTQICHAVQHAHQKGIIHRDLKPSNVLVTQRDAIPIVKVIDFGLAKAFQPELQLSDKTLLTQFGQAIGTLEYMSPEQAEMNESGLDTRTDIYSLGVLLYELLVGSTPLGRERVRSEAYHRLLELVVTQETPRPSQRLSDSGEAITRISEQRRIEPDRLRGILKTDLDWIALKALEKDRNRRYQGAGSLANDVQNYLRGEAVEARPPSTGYRLQKAIRKHKRAFVSAAVFVLLLLVGFLSTGGMWLLARQEARRANIAETRAFAESDKAKYAAAQERIARQNMEAEKVKAEATLARSNYFLAVARWDANRPAEANELLDQISPEYRGFEWRLAKRQFGGAEVTCYGHRSGVTSVCFSPDGTLIASASLDGEIKLWAGYSGAELNTLRGHSGAINQLSFSPDGKSIASASSDDTVKLWDAVSGQELKTLKGHLGDVTSASFSPDGTLIASASLAGKIKLWTASDGEELRTLVGHTGAVNSVSFSPDNTRLVSGSTVSTPLLRNNVRIIAHSGEIRLWNVQSGEEGWTAKGHSGAVNSVSFSPDGRWIASASSDHTVKLWNAQTGDERWTAKGHTGWPTSVSFSPDGTQVASASLGNEIKLWDVRSGDELKSLKGHSGDVKSVCFGPAGRRLASASYDQTVKLWDLRHDEEFATLAGHQGGVTSICFNADGNQLVSGGNVLIVSTTSTGGKRTQGGHGVIRLWDARSGEELWALRGHERWVNSVSFSPDGMQIASASRDRTIKLWDARSGAERRTLRGHQRSINSVSFSPDGTRLASASFDKTIKLWDTRSGQLLHSLAGHSRDVTSVVFSPDGAWLASSSRDNTIKLWDARTGAKLRTITGHTGFVQSVTFSNDGTRIASASADKTIKLWNARSGEELRTLNGHKKIVVSASFSPDGSRIASTSADNTVKLWDAWSGEELRTLNGHTRWINAVRFRPDGEALASASFDGTIKLWNALDGEEARTLRGHTDTVVGVSFSHDGERLYSTTNQQREQFVWSTKSGMRIKGAEWLPTPPANNRSPDGRWLAVTVGTRILLVDLAFKNRDYEQAYRTFIATPKPYWHEQQAVQALQREDWFAATFHSAWWLKLNPESREAYDGLHQAHRQLGDDVAKLLPRTIAGSLEIPEPAKQK